MTTPQNTNRRGLTIRRLDAADAAAVRRLAGLDSVPVPSGELLGLEVEGRLLAVQPLAEGGTVIADPFARTAEVRALLELRAEQLRARAYRPAERSRFERAPERVPHPLMGLARTS